MRRGEATCLEGSVEEYMVYYEVDDGQYGQ